LKYLSYLKALIPLSLLALSVGSSYRRSSSPIRVAILDTGLDLSDSRFKGVLCSSGHKDFTGQGIQDDHGHGTHIAGLIKEYAGNSNYCLIILKYYQGDGRVSMKPYLAALEYISDLSPDVVNFSGGGEERSETEAKLIHQMSHVTFITAAGNEKANLQYNEYFPATLGYKNIIVVGNLRTNLTERASSSNYNYHDMRWEVGEWVTSTLPNGRTGKMSGTSQAAAVHTGKFLKQIAY
jgi:major intracellular serine protease